MKVIIAKPDLDTCLTGLILGVGPGDEVVAVRGNASSADLDDPEVLCIEVGGAGQVDRCNFDHHDTETYFPPACSQAYLHAGTKDERLARLVQYVSMVDENSKDHPPVSFPSLSNLFSGMLFVEKGAVVQFHAGIILLQAVLDKVFDPFGTLPVLPEWEPYITAKLGNQERLAEMLSHAEYHTSRSGLQIGYSEHDAIGGIGALYQQGCHVVILLSEQFGDPPIRKFTIAGNRLSVGHLAPFFEELEAGWGGRQTILGSPRDKDSRLSKDQVLAIVKEHL